MPRALDLVTEEEVSAAGVQHYRLSSLQETGAAATDLADARVFCNADEVRLALQQQIDQRDEVEVARDVR